MSFLALFRTDYRRRAESLRMQQRGARLRGDERAAEEFARRAAEAEARAVREAWREAAR